MIFGSVCSGIEAASAAWVPIGWSAAFLSEIDPFCCRVLAARCPGVPNYGDLTRHAEWPDAAVSVLVGGTPCQSFSTAGRREGLKDERGALVFSYLGVVARYRPRWVVWENVPGVLSSGGGRDFGAFLGALGDLGYGFAYRVLDAQHFGVPQRRRRVFVVGRLGDWRGPAEVLLEPEGVRGDPETSRPTRARPARRSTPRSRGASTGPLIYQQHGSDVYPMGALRRGRGDVQSGIPFGIVAPSATLVTDMRNAVASGQVTPTLQTHHGSYSVNSLPCVLALDTYNQRTSALSPTLRDPNGTLGDALPAVWPVEVGIRRLTPRECERLQGFPTCSTRVIIEVDFDHPSNCAHVALRCRKWQSNALPADADETAGYVRFADNCLLNDQESRESLVAVHVRMSSAPKVVAVRNLGKWSWNANGAKELCWFHPPLDQDDFAHTIAELVRLLVALIPPGKEAGLPSTTISTTPKNGRWLAAMFRYEKKVIANDVKNMRIEAIKYIISKLDPSIPKRSLNAQTLLFYALVVINLCIPTETPVMSSWKGCFDIETDWTAVPGASDSSRYRAIGNSMAVPVVRWIGERIADWEAHDRS